MSEQQTLLSEPQLHYWGKTPEQDYYNQQGINSSNSFFTSPRGLTLFTRSWIPLSTPPRGIICMVHGYGNDISWTFQATAIFFAQKGFACFAIDIEGHGRSQGLKAYVPNVDLVVKDCIFFFNSVTEQNPQFHGLPKFLYGESMGGAICLLISNSNLGVSNSNPNLGFDGGISNSNLGVSNSNPNLGFDGAIPNSNLGVSNSSPNLGFDGAILVAPMCKISDKIKPRWPIPEILSFVAKFLPTLAIVPTADVHAKSIKVEEKKVIGQMNPMRYNGKPRLGTVLELLRVTDYLSRRISEVEIPFLVLHGSADVVTDPNVSRELYEEAKSEDKSLKIYEGMMHSLMFGETDENIEIVRSDILAWLNHRCR